MGKTQARLRAKWAERESEYQRLLGRVPQEDTDETAADAETGQPEAGRSETGQAATGQEAGVGQVPAARRPKEPRAVAPPPDAKPYQVVCPRCAAPAANPCQTAAGRPVRPHADRVRAAATAGHRASRMAAALPENMRDAAEEAPTP
ncbi:hypothetical protein [Actinocorallia sp. A-T 12471]|uniref:hypothetical protein n=1 Tax=Actinocorallia sp. A-T 12471 TaxID=3089813 RepID=UPI0029CD92B8|nr:hypothetical protein [Actinocorallia sp. A-T 12471]MDX6742345.1 hypothetical protein [Actinocorallia sp. A-T 12471]